MTKGIVPILEEHLLIVLRPGIGRFGKWSYQNVIQEPKTAIGEAKKDVSDLALWSDGSKLESGGAGAAVVWKNSTSHRWAVRKVSLGENMEIW